MGPRLGPFLLWSGLTLVLLVGIVLRTAWYPAIAPLAAPVAIDRAQVARGAQLARLGNCASCHTVASGQPFAGGRPLRTPFGAIYGTNIIPDRDTVTVFTGKAELGQGIKTALIQVAAEQLEVDPSSPPHHDGYGPDARGWLHGWQPIHAGQRHGGPARRRAGEVHSD